MLGWKKRTFVLHIFINLYNINLHTLPMYLHTFPLSVIIKNNILDKIKYLFDNNVNQKKKNIYASSPEPFRLLKLWFWKNPFVMRLYVVIRTFYPNNK